MKIQKTEILRQGVLVCLLLGMVMGAWYFVFRPRDLEDKDMRLQIAAKQRHLQKLNRATATIGNLKEEIANLDKAIQFFRSKLPNEKEIDKVLEEVWRLAEANNLTTKGIYTARRSAASPFVA
jgi:Tfp pilus assembly protein PilO